jgi:hypothetical protein
MPALDDLTGRVFERLTIIRGTNDPVKAGGVHVVAYECVCACGSKLTVAGHRLRGDKTRSCGCIRRKDNN